ncbi:MAG: hypothetical protein O1I87_12165 [Cylindrospermopsis raciborskii PAMP2012]|uniref:hypothetical protein n=1 Tax=Cylindrospermopsis raciborskii TaxID=77022 RepID=UPI000B1B99B5|nr:hypothetical protein [Cylindrospermopsis raciborskii]MCZ2202681.1 hypothetical protein [Cylindrospermopsis raciborskii PAMP2012]
MKFIKYHFCLTLALSGKILLATPLYATDMDKPVQTPNNNSGNIEVVSINHQRNILEKFAGLKNAVKSLNQDLKTFVQDKKNTGSLNSKKVISQINQLKQEVAKLSLTPQLFPSVKRTNSIIRELDRTMKYLEDGLKKNGVTGIQKYLGFFAKRRVNNKYYGNFGETTQQEIEKFTNKKIQELEKEIKIISSLTPKSLTARNSKKLVLSNSSNVSNIDGNINNDSNSDKVINPNSQLYNSSNNSEEMAALKRDLSRMGLIIVVLSLMFAVFAIVCLYKLYEVLENPDNLNRLTKNNQDIKNIYQELKNLSGRLKKLETYRQSLTGNPSPNSDQSSKSQLDPSSASSQITKQVNQINSVNPGNPQKPTMGTSYKFQKLSGSSDSNKELSGELNSTANPGNKLAREYNSGARSLANTAITVSESELTAEQRRLGRDSQPILEPNNRGNYWIINYGDMDYLVPKPTMKVNNHNYNTMSRLFNCLEYDPNSSKSFTLINPAKVSPIGEKWQLVEEGELQF